MNYKPLPIGIDNFEELILNDYFYLDKTIFIKELLDQKTKVHLLTRPRRFCKTNIYNPLSVIKYLYDLLADPNAHPLAKM